MKLDEVSRKVGAWGETRTRTEGFSLPRDFKSLVSTISPPRHSPHILTQVTGFCQFPKAFFFSVFFTFVLLGISSCSIPEIKDEKGATPRLEKLDEEVKAVENKSIGPFWFSTAERFKSYDEQGELYIHPFFDHEANVLGDDQSLYFYPLISENSPFRYEFDLSSGKTYKSCNNCEQKDVWGKYDGKIELPPFTEGIVPRLLDEQGKPQRVIVFGNSQAFSNPDNAQGSLSPVRIVGGVYEQFCRNYPCLDQELWTSRLIFVAVDDRDSKFKAIRDFNQLKSKIDWPYVKAYLQNAQGKSLQAAGEYPAYRIFGEMDADKAFELTYKRGHLFKKDELVNLRKTCEKLYDSLYSMASQTRERLSKNKNNITSQGKSEFLFWNEETITDDDYINGLANTVPISKRNVWKHGDELLADLQAKEAEANAKRAKEKELQRLKKSINKEVGAVGFFKVFWSKYLNPYMTCERYVRPANINDDPERHWFFTYVSALSHVYQLGYYFNCPKRAWVENIIDDSGKYRVDPFKELNRCGNFDIDYSFTEAVKQLVLRGKNNLEHYAYIEYDNSEGGTHKKIHSWVYFSGKNQVCTKSKQSVETLQSEKDRFIFPDDVRWVPFIPVVKNGDEL